MRPWELISVAPHRERLVNASRDMFLTFTKSKGTMDLMVPAEVRVVDKVPVLGTGKIDFASVTRLVHKKLGVKVKAA